MLTTCDKHQDTIVVYDSPILASCPICYPLSTEEIDEFQNEINEWKEESKKLEAEIEELKSDMILKNTELENLKVQLAVKNKDLTEYYDEEFKEENKRLIEQIDKMYYKKG